MQNGNENQNKPSGTKPPPLRLPFSGRKADPGIWSYRNRRGICVTLIVYLSLGIIFMTSKIMLTPRWVAEGILIEFPEEPRQQERIETPRYESDPYDFSQVSNRLSNENAELNDQLPDAKGIDARQLYSDAQAVQDRMAANRQAYEDGLAAAAERPARSGEQSTTDTQATSRVSGKVTVSYSFTDPIRNAVNLIVPAYTCRGGGEITLNVTLDNNGYVTSASLDKARSNGDDCMQRNALQAARASRFNLDTSAPNKHRGTITYVFIPE